jgi:hypothetical protein
MIRLAPSATLSATVTINEVRFDAKSDLEEQRWLDWRQVGDTLHLYNLGLGSANKYQLRLVYEAPFKALPNQTQINDTDGITAADTALAVEAGTSGVLLDVWPTTGYMQIENEIVRYDRLTSTTAYIERAKAGTLAATHANDTVIYAVFPGTDAKAELLKKFALAQLFGDQQMRVKIGSDQKQAYDATARSLTEQFYRMKEDPMYRLRSLPLVRRA